MNFRKEDFLFNDSEEKINFPPGFPEENRVQICKLLEKKDSEIKRLDKQVDDLTYKCADSISYQEAEQLRTERNKAVYLMTAVHRELDKFHLKAIQYEPTDYPIRPFDIRLEKISLYYRFVKYLKSLIPFELKLKK